MPIVAAIAAHLVACERPKEPAPAELNPPLFRTLPCIHFEKLREFLPRALPGYQQRGDEGSTGKYGDVTMSEAERTFRQKDGREVVVRIVDSTLSRRLAAKIRAAAEAAAGDGGPDAATPLSLGEAVGYIHYDPTDERAEANLLVGGRYLVAVTGRGFAGPDEVEKVARQLDLVGLAKMR